MRRIAIAGLALALALPFVPACGSSGSSERNATFVGTTGLADADRIASALVDAMLLGGQNLPSGLTVGTVANPLAAEQGGTSIQVLGGSANDGTVTQTQTIVDPEARNLNGQAVITRRVVDSQDPSRVFYEELRQLGAAFVAVSAIPTDLASAAGATQPFVSAGTGDHFALFVVQRSETLQRTFTNQPNGTGTTLVATSPPATVAPPEGQVTRTGGRSEVILVRFQVTASGALVSAAALLMTDRNLAAGGLAATPQYSVTTSTIDGSPFVSAGAAIGGTLADSLGFSTTGTLAVGLAIPGVPLAGEAFSFSLDAGPLSDAQTVSGTGPFTLSLGGTLSDGDITAGPDALPILITGSAGQLSLVGTGTFQHTVLSAEDLYDIGFFTQSATLVLFE